MMNGGMDQSSFPVGGFKGPRAAQQAFEDVMYTPTPEGHFGNKQYDWSTAWNSETNTLEFSNSKAGGVEAGRHVEAELAKKGVKAKYIASDGDEWHCAERALQKRGHKLQNISTYSKRKPAAQASYQWKEMEGKPGVYKKDPCVRCRGVETQFRRRQTPAMSEKGNPHPRRVNPGSNQNGAPKRPHWGSRPARPANKIPATKTPAPRTPARSPGNCPPGTRMRYGTAPRNAGRVAGMGRMARGAGFARGGAQTAATAATMWYGVFSMGGFELANVGTELIGHHAGKREQFIDDIQDQRFNKPEGTTLTPVGYQTQRELKVTRAVSDLNFKWINFFTFGLLGD
jgi:hypothetical protein